MHATVLDVKLVEALCNHLGSSFYGSVPFGSVSFIMGLGGKLVSQFQKQ
jgi:hypothetical protein